jgi:phosphate transport system substrate-binding protein
MRKFAPRHILVLLFALLIPMLAACGGSTANTPTAAPATEAPAATEAATAASATEAPATSEPSAEAPVALDTLPEVDPAAVTGNIVTAGSSTVYPLSQAMVERFASEGYAGNITIDSVGTGGGFERFCTAGETDIANASRDIKDSEIEACAAIGRTPIEFRVGTDAISVVMSSANDFVSDLTIEQLAAIFNGDAKTWADVDASWPAEPIQLFSPGSDSGTYDYFVEVVLEKDDSKLQASGAQFSENDNVLVQGVESSPYAIGYFGYAYFVENAGKLKAVSIGGVEPNAESAEDGSYPLSRPLYLYADAGVIAEKPQVGEFINFYLTYVNENITEVGYFPASDAALEDAKAKLLAALNGETAAPAASSETAPVAASLPEVDPAAVTGNIVTAGSSTVYPLSQAMVERFASEGYAGNITIDSVGTGGGFERFCTAGETDIANASRDIKDSEIEACAAIGRTPIEFRVGTDAISVVMSSANDFVSDLTIEQLAAIFNGDAKTWADVDASWPAEPIQLFSPGSDSGTYDYFVEIVLDEDDSKLQASGAQFSENDNVLVQGVESSPYAIGYFGYAYFVENAGKLKAVSIGGVEPNAESAEDGSYPLSRPLYLYSDAGVIAEKPQVGEFINFYLTYVNENITEVGYFPASDAALEDAKSKLIAALGQ